MNIREQENQVKSSTEIVIFSSIFSPIPLHIALVKSRTREVWTIFTYRKRKKYFYDKMVNCRAVLVNFSWCQRKKINTSWAVELIMYFSFHCRRLYEAVKNSGFHNQWSQAIMSLVSTWMGYHWGTLSAVVKDKYRLCMRTRRPLEGHLTLVWPESHLFNIFLAGSDLVGSNLRGPKTRALYLFTWQIVCLWFFTSLSTLFHL